MKQFYALINYGKDKNGVLPLESNQPLQAEIEAKALCRENDLTLQEVRLVRGTVKQNGTMVKELGDKTSTRRGRK